MNVEFPNNARTSFGPREIEKRLPYAVDVYGPVRQLILPIKFDELPAHVAGDETGAYIPANSVILNVIATPATTAFAGGTSFEISLVENDGSPITDVVTAATTAVMNSGGELTVADATVGSEDGYFVVEATGTYTAGEGAVIISYVEQK